MDAGSPVVMCPSASFIAAQSSMRIFHVVQFSVPFRDSLSLRLEIFSGVVIATIGGASGFGAIGFVRDVEVGVVLPDGDWNWGVGVVRPEAVV